MSGRRHSLLSPGDRAVAACISRIAMSNPFAPERIECERELLGGDYDTTVETWNLWPDLEGRDPNVAAAVQRATELLRTLRRRLDDADVAATDDELALYEDVALFALYYRFHDELADLVARAARGDGPAHAPFYPAFRRAAT